MLGAQVTLIDGLITDCGAAVRQGVAEHGWFDVSTLKEPYCLEGKKTMGYELAEQTGWRLPDVIIYLTGGGTGLVGMWRWAFAGDAGGIGADRAARLAHGQRPARPLRAAGAPSSRATSSPLWQGRQDGGGWSGASRGRRFHPAAPYAKAAARPSP